jgi:metallo-beta-lactamase class B
MAISSDAKYERPWECRMPAFRVAGNLYFVGNSSGATWLLDTPEGPVLFDTNYPTLAPLLLDSICEAGFSPESITAIFHTHGHFDHYGATEQIKARSGATSYMSKTDARLLAQRPEMGLAHQGKYIFPEPPAVDVELEDEDVITVGGIPIRCVACPGHSPGAMSYFFPVTENGKTYTAAIHGGAGLGTLSRDFMEQYGVNWRQDFVDSIEKLMEEPVDIFLANHTKMCHTAEKYRRLQQGENAFIDPAGWRNFLLSLRKDYETLCLQEQNAQ